MPTASRVKVRVRVRVRARVRVRVPWYAMEVRGRFRGKPWKGFAAGGATATPLHVATKGNNAHPPHY